MMKPFLIACSMALALSMTGIAGATPVYFDLAGRNGGSSVSISEIGLGANLTASLANNLDSQIFTLNDGETRAVNFFTLTTSGFGGGIYSIAATLAFDQPDIHAVTSGSGYGVFCTFLSVLSGETLKWDPNSLPDAFTVAGNTISIDFEDISTFGIGNTTMVHAYITNEGGGTTPVPEPSTILLLGISLVAVAFFSRWRMKINT